MNKNLLYKKRIISWPKIINGLTITRILLGLPIVLTLINGDNDIFILLLIISGLTDFFDGYFARKFNHKSVFGAKLDPLADKIVLLGPMIWLVHEDMIPLWAIWLIISRELLITSWRSEKSTGEPASIQGKYKTALQFLSIIFLFWPSNWGTTSSIYIVKKIGFSLFWIALILTLSSGLEYIFNQKVNRQN